MGAYNRLRAQVKCPNCGETVERIIQVAYGDAWLHDYAIGDSLHWGGNDIGRPGSAKAAMAGVGEECPSYWNHEEFSVVIERDVITGVETGSGHVPRAEDGNLYRIVTE